MPDVDEYFAMISYVWCTPRKLTTLTHCVSEGCPSVWDEVRTSGKGRLCPVRLLAFWIFLERNLSLASQKSNTRSPENGPTWSPKLSVFGECFPHNALGDCGKPERCTGGWTSGRFPLTGFMQSTMTNTSGILSKVCGTLLRRCFNPLQRIFLIDTRHRLFQTWHVGEILFKTCFGGFPASLIVSKRFCSVLFITRFRSFHVQVWWRWVQVHLFVFFKAYAMHCHVFNRFCHARHFRVSVVIVCLIETDRSERICDHTPKRKLWLEPFLIQFCVHRITVTLFFLFVVFEKGRTRP